MGNLFSALNSLKSNIFGGGGTGTVTPMARNSAIELAQMSPTSALDIDPYQFTSLFYPRNLFSTTQHGHYIQFYVNVQNQTKYEYEGLDSEHKKVTVGDMVEVPEHWKQTGGHRLSATYHKTTSAKSGDHLRADYQKQIIKNGGAGNILYNNIVGGHILDENPCPMFCHPMFYSTFKKKIIFELDAYCIHQKGGPREEEEEQVV